jgi:hypothetical protein
MRLRLTKPTPHVQVMVRKGVIPFEYQKERGTRIGLLRREFVNGERTQWFTLPSFMAFHVVRPLTASCRFSLAKSSKIRHFWSHLP